MLNVDGVCSSKTFSALNSCEIYIPTPSNQPKLFQTYLFIHERDDATHRRIAIRFRREGHVSDFYFCRDNDNGDKEEKLLLRWKTNKMCRVTGEFLKDNKKYKVVG